MYKGYMDKAKEGWDGGWEMGMGGAGVGSGVGKMETTIKEEKKHIP